MIPGTLIPPPSASVGPALSLSYRSTFGNSGNTTSYGYNIDIGTAASDRYVIGVVAAECSSGEADGAVFNGVTASRIVHTKGATSKGTAAIFVAAVPSGSGTQLCTFTFSATAANMGGAVFTTNALPSQMAPTGSQIDTDDGGQAEFTVDVFEDGFVVAIVFSDSLAPGAATWSGISNTGSQVFETNRFDHAYDEIATSETGKAIATTNLSDADNCGVIASFR